MTLRGLIAASFVVSAVLACPRWASASANYPGVVQTEWQLQGPPECTICHQSNAGGAGTATKFFARSLQEAGLINKDEGSLRKALADLKMANTDSDGDGVSDIDELQMASDPNDGPGPMHPLPTPMTGCTLHVTSGRTPADSLVWLLASAIAALALCTRRRPPR